jgi:hypothetical protein
MRSALVRFTSAALFHVATASDKFAEGSKSRELMRINGAVSAVFTPTDAQGNLDVTKMPKLAARLKEWGVANVMVGGTTGESTDFSTAERLRAV